MPKGKSLTDEIKLIQALQGRSEAAFKSPGVIFQGKVTNTALGFEANLWDAEDIISPQMIFYIQKTLY